MSPPDDNLEHMCQRWLHVASEDQILIFLGQLIYLGSSNLQRDHVLSVGFNYFLQSIFYIPKNTEACKT